ncbi:hypothetical protein EVAR_94379_1 [Eumeta japonica]|uniref:Uncharacterized protein n=1 Tax=Eumeta variegata TaxID=151549 RepID=A0A4C1TPZ2_EUMVA|nr:hypothetical protein EVAR_94379_1 [Eumeta japonica]
MRVRTYATLRDADACPRALVVVRPFSNKGVRSITQRYRLMPTRLLYEARLKRCVFTYQHQNVRMRMRNPASRRISQFPNVSGRRTIPNYSQTKNKSAVYITARGKKFSFKTPPHCTKARFICVTHAYTLEIRGVRPRRRVRRVVCAPDAHTPV